MLRYRIWLALVPGELLQSTRPGQKELFLSALADIERALAGCDPTASMHADAARLYAVLARDGDDQDVKRFRSHLSTAVRLGESPGNLDKDVIVTDALQKLALVHPLPGPTKAATSRPDRPG